MVSIAAFQAVDPGSIPGRRSFFYIFFSMSNYDLSSSFLSLLSRYSVECRDFQSFISVAAF